MSLDISHSNIPRSSQDRALEAQVQGDLNISPRRETSSTISNDHLDEVPSPAAYKEDIRPVSSGLQGREKQPQDTFSIEESAEARLERLGRQRPEVFDSTWSEIGFVFSISMCQVLSVCSPLGKSYFDR